MSDPLICSDQGPVRVLTLNRPESRNALSRNLIRALYAALKESDADQSVRAVVLTGADPAFCAGVDLKEAARDGMDYFNEFQRNSCIAAVAEMRTPILGAINGATFTGGLELTGGLRLSRRIRTCCVRPYPRPGRDIAWWWDDGSPAKGGRRCDGAAPFHDRRGGRCGQGRTHWARHRSGRTRPATEPAAVLAAQICEVPAGIMLGLKEIYVRGASAVVDPGVSR